MISQEQFETAIKIICDYEVHLENEINNKSKDRFVNIQKKITSNTFRVLKSYFSSTYGIDLEWSDLKVMNLELLKSLDYKMLRMYRGFGVLSENRLKSLIESFNATKEF